MMPALLPPLLSCYLFCFIRAFWRRLLLLLLLLLQTIPPKGNHTLPPRPRVPLHKGDGRTLADFERLLRPFAAKNRTCAQRLANQGSVAVASGASTGK
jgi:hypothetical protein